MRLKGHSAMFRFRADLVLAYVRRDHHEDRTPIDQDDSDHVVQRADVILNAVKVVVAVSFYVPGPNISPMPIIQETVVVAQVKSFTAK